MIRQNARFRKRKKAWNKDPFRIVRILNLFDHLF